MSDIQAGNGTDNNARIAKNTLFLYFRMLIILVVTLFTSRIILQSLGVDDFGIYSVVGGIIAMFRFLNGALSDASQRYITFEIGRGNDGEPNKIFSISLLLHILLGIIVVIIAEPIGIWFIYNKLVIPIDRLYAAFWIYQFTIISMFVLLISVPYNALIIAHEKMSAFAFISIFDVLMRLGIAFSLFFCKNYDKLILYGFLILLSQIVIRFMYTFYCEKHFKESKYKFYWDKNLIKEMGGFASWTILGNFVYLSTTQGLNLLLGVFFAPAINAARGIAVQVQGALDTFVRNFQTAINPQITKNYASNEIGKMQELVFCSCRFSFFLMLIPLIPIICETKIILSLWLVNVPRYSIEFTQLALLLSCCSALINPLEVSIKATGKIKTFEIIVYGIKILVFPIGYIFLLNGFSPIFVFSTQCLLEIIAFAASVKITSQSIGFNLKEFSKILITKIIPVAVFAFAIPICVIWQTDDSITRFCFLTLFSFIWTSALVFIIGLSKRERNAIIHKIKKTEGYD